MCLHILRLLLTTVAIKPTVISFPKYVLLLWVSFVISNNVLYSPVWNILNNTYCFIKIFLKTPLVYSVLNATSLCILYVNAYSVLCFNQTKGKQCFFVHSCQSLACHSRRNYTTIACLYASREAKWYTQKIKKIVTIEFCNFRSLNKMYRDNKKGQNSFR